MNLGGSGGSRAREKRKLKWELRRKKAEMNLGGGGRKRDNEQNRRGDKWKHTQVSAKEGRRGKREKREQWREQKEEDGGLLLRDRPLIIHGALSTPIEGENRSCEPWKQPTRSSSLLSLPLFPPSFPQLLLNMVSFVCCVFVAQVVIELFFCFKCDSKSLSYGPYTLRDNSNLAGSLHSTLSEMALIKSQFQSVTECTISISWHVVW